VLSGNRNFEGRVNVDVRANYLMSPPLVVAYALAGGSATTSTPIRWATTSGKPVYLRDIWPTQQEVAAAIEKGLAARLPPRVRDGERRRRELAGAEVSHRRCLPVGAGLDLHPQGAVLRRHDARRPRRSTDIPARACWPCWATR
jgi:hypothetical protein